MKTTFGKKMVVGSLVLALAIPSTVGATSVAGEDQEVMVIEPSNSVNIDHVASPKVTVVKHVPIRKALEYVGAKVQWQSSDRSVTVEYLGQTLKIDVEQSTATLNDQPFPFTGDVEFTEGLVYVPLELIQSALDLHIDWDAANSKVTFNAADYIAKATTFVTQIKAGQVADVTALFNDDVKMFFPEQLIPFWTNLSAIYGEIEEELLAVQYEENSVHHNVTLVYKAEVMPLAMIIRFDQEGLIDDLFVDATFAQTGGYAAPEYDQPANYTEQEVKIGEGSLALPGTLTLPKGEGPFPVVVLVHGSGAHDRDSSVGGAKVFRDIAVGLANEGIASLRYEKVTREHSLKATSSPTFTIQRETADDALSAVELLSTMEQIAADQIYIVGHSQGGLMVPRMIELDEEKQIAGAVLLAGPAQSFQDVLIEQQLYLLEVVEELGLPVEQFIPSAELLIRQAEIIKDPQYSPLNLPEDFQLHPAYYWFEQRDYVPVEVAKEQDTPLLILQGENDWQVSMKQFEVWKKELSGKQHVQFKSYPHLNHLLTEFDQISIGLEYGIPANVSLELIKDIAKWVHEQK